MSKSKIYKALSAIIAFILVIILTMTSNIAADNTVSITNNMTLENLIAQASNGDKDWYGFDPSDAVGKIIIPGQATIQKTNSRCLDPMTSYYTNGLYNSYSIVNIVDINVEDNKIKVYKSDKSVKEVDITSEEAKPLLILAYLTKMADEVDKTNDDGHYKSLIWQLLTCKEFVENLCNTGISESFRLNRYNNKSLDVLKWGMNSAALKEALNKTQRIQEEAKGTEKASISVNMTENQKQQVSVTEINGKTFIGPYNLRLNNGCKIDEITINDKIKASGISTDKENIRSVDNIKDKENFYIVTDTKVNEIKEIKVKGTSTRTSYKARIVFCGQTTNQHYLVWRSEETDTNPEVDLEVPKYGSLEIVKKDEFENSDLDLSGIGFKIYKEGMGKGWLTNTGEFKLFKDATEFKTNSQGKISLDKIPLGEYRVYETSIPERLQKYYNITETHKFYSTEDLKTKTPYTAKLIKNGIKVTSTDPVKVTAKNTRAYTSLYIDKRDKKDSSKVLNGIVFKIYSLKDKGWVQTDDKNVVTSTKATIENASELVIISNHTQTITQLPVGEYQVFETSVGPNYQYHIGTYTMEDGTVINANDMGKHKLKANETGVVEKIVLENEESANIKIKKTDQVTGEPLQGIKFKILDKTGTDAWVQVKQVEINGKYEYQYVRTVTKYYDSAVSSNDWSKEEPRWTDWYTTFETDKNGETITIKGLPADHTYRIYEVGLPDKYKDIYTLDKHKYTEINEDKTTNEIEFDGIRLNKTNSHFTGTSSVSDEGSVTLVPVKGKNGVGAGVVEIGMTNKPNYISISGIVWEDVEQGKDKQKLNNLLDSDDYRINGITVKLKDAQGNEVSSTTTGNYQYKGVEQNGVYRFDKVSIAKLDQYYIEFSYDGVTYQSLINPQGIDDDTIKSSASELAENRNALNRAFAEITGEGQVVRYNNQDIKLQYNKEKDDKHTSVTLRNICDREQGLDMANKLVKLTKTGDFGITSVTNNNYLKEQYNKDTSVTEITDINLGLIKREQPNLSLSKDVDSADISINGKHYVYNKYGRKQELAEESNEPTETALGVRFTDKTSLNDMITDYNVPIYQADAVYVNEEDKSKELNVSIIYKLSLTNNSVLYTRVNELKDIYSKDLKLEDVYSADANMDIKVKHEEITGDYTQTTISGLNIELEPHQEKYVYVKFKLPIEKIRDIVNRQLFDNEIFENHVEITNYSIGENASKYEYAGYDTTSIPNNYNVLEAVGTDEDDSDYAPGIKIVDAGVRTISGTVFEDTDENTADDERKGNGKFDENENKVSQVKVRLLDLNGTEVSLYDSTNKTTYTQNAVTNENGEYTISGFIPGDYVVQFTWGEGEKTKIGNDIVTVDKYKSTIWTPANRKEKESLENTWYYGETRYSDALDNYKLRNDLDKGTKSLMETLNAKTTDARMLSTTKQLDVGIELKDYNTEKVNGIPVYKFDIANVDFGIIERPIQAIAVEKNVDSLVIKEPSTNINIVDGKMNAEGKLEGTVKDVSGGKNEGFIYVAIKPEKLQGGNAYVGYKVAIKNISERDYASENYYLYGEIDNNAKPITLTTKNVYDYLRELVPDTTNKANWDTISNSELKDKVETTVIDTVVKNRITYPTIANIVAQWSGAYATKYGSQIDNKEMNTQAITNMKFDNAVTSKNNDEQLELAPGEVKEYDFNGNVIIDSSKSLVFENDVEIGNVERNSEIGRSISLENSKLYAAAQKITITEATGGDKNYAPIIIISISAIALLGIGVVVIKKTVLKK